MCETHNRVIRAVGGKARLAEALSLSSKIVTKWHERGIPSKYWGEVVEICAALNPPYRVTIAELKRTKPTTASAAGERCAA